jgi:hypothetical protein
MNKVQGKYAMAEAARTTYWGIGGQYGPFSEQKEGEWAGWPDFGQVLRYFRKRAGLTAKAFGVIYGKGVNPDGRPVSERQILRMELENQIPVDMTRRNLIARLLNIPPMLLGIASLEDVILQPHPQVANAKIARGQTSLQKVAVDTSTYQNNIRAFWTLHDTSQIQYSLLQIASYIQDLENLQLQTQGDLLYHIQELLFGYRLLASHVVRDQRQFNNSYIHANEAVQVAKAMQDKDLIATALYTRGCTHLEWGMFGTLKQGIFQIQQNKIEAAIRDLEGARKVYEEEGKGIHPQLLSRVDVHLGRAYALMSSGKGEQASPSTLALLDQAEEGVEVHNVDDPYTCVLVTGHRGAFIKAGFHEAKAAAFVSAGLASAALKELNVRSAQQPGVGKDLTRRHVWSDILLANALMQLENYEEATQCARNALLASQDINSTTNLTNIVDIYGRLLKSPYKNERDLQDLGDQLRDALSAQMEKRG